MSNLFLVSVAVGNILPIGRGLYATSAVLKLVRVVFLSIVVHIHQVDLSVVHVLWER